MNRFALCLCLALAMIAGLVAPAIAADGAVNGVLVEERVVNLPQDQNMWYLSVVGSEDNSRYQQILGWFNTDQNLRTLKSQVHFCPVKFGSAIYKERYASNIKTLPTVRLQTHEGVVVYESAGLAIPATPSALYTDMADKAQTAQGCRPILPWRREIDRRTCPDNRCQPQPQPQPQPEPLPDDQPLPDEEVGPPDMAQPEPQSVLPAWWAMLLAMAVGGVVGAAVKWQETYAKK